MSAATFTLLRQRFGATEELSRHLHAIDNRALLFFRDASLELAGGAKVLLEVSFTSSEQQLVLRGQVIGGVTEGALRGLWLEFPDLSLAARTQLPKERKQRRLACDALVQIRRDDHPHLGRLTDLSLGGARLGAIAGVRPGDEVELRVVSDNASWPSELGRALVVRSDLNEVGTRFLRTESSSRMAVTRLFSALQESWARSPLVDHPPICCKNGALLEPPLPRMKGRISSSGIPR